jgi:hypothetical protein
LPHDSGVMSPSLDTRWDYMQKATGLVNTMANLSTAGGAGGATYDPLNTAITAANVERYFSHGIVDPTGQAKAGFQALIAFLNADRVA